MNPILLAKALLLLTLPSSPALAADSRTLGNVVLEEVPEIPAELAERMLQYQNTRGAGLFDWDPRGQGLLMGTRFSETFQLHWLAAPMGARTQLTFFKEPVSNAALNPAPDRRELVLSMDKGGDEAYQLYLFGLDEARPRLLTDGKSRHENPRWSRRGDRLVFNGTARNGKDFDFYLVEPGKAPPRLLASAEGQWSSRDWSPDDSRLLVMKYVSINETYPHLLDAASGKLEPLFPARTERKVAYGEVRWWAGGQGVLFTSDEAGEFMRLGSLDLATRKVDWLTADIPWNVEELAVSRDGTRAAFVVNEDGLAALYLGAPGAFRRLAGLPMGLVYSLEFSPDGSRLAFVMNRPESPGDIYTLDWPGKDLTRWTRSETGGLPASAFVAPTLVRYPTFDRVEGKPRTIPAFYYRPRGSGSHPVIVSIHGGPEAQARPYFSPTLQYWVNELGAAVLVPNVRGSDGYGKSSLLLDNGFQREDSVKDIGALLDWVATRPELDAKRVAVYGGSYGGYMVLASLAHFPERLAAGAELVGISNFVTFLKNTKEYRRDLRRAEYGDERDPAMEAHLQAISPTTIASRIRSPLFVLQGANDPRVPASEAGQIVAEVRGGARGPKVWYLLALDEGHGFAKKSNRDLADQAVTLFWERHLLGRP